MRDACPRFCRSFVAVGGMGAVAVVVAGRVSCGAAAVQDTTAWLAVGVGCSGRLMVERFSWDQQEPSGTAITSRRGPRCWSVFYCSWGVDRRSGVPELNEARSERSGELERAGPYGNCRPERSVDGTLERVPASARKWERNDGETGGALLAHWGDPGSGSCLGPCHYGSITARCPASCPRPATGGAVPLPHRQHAGAMLQSSRQPLLMLCLRSADLEPAPTLMLERPHPRRIESSPVGGGDARSLAAWSQTRCQTCGWTGPMHECVL
eukprot:gene17472-biopygen9394